MLPVVICACPQTFLLRQSIENKTPKTTNNLRIKHPPRIFVDLKLDVMVGHKPAGRRRGLNRLRLGATNRRIQYESMDKISTVSLWKSGPLHNPCRRPNA